MLKWFISWDARTVIAVVALVQPWLYWAYRKYWKGGSIDVHEIGTVEVGYSRLGTTVALQGTMRAVDREFFVSSVSLDLVREADGARQTFEWGAFRPPTVLVGDTKDPIEIPAGFMVQPQAPRRYNIVFVDRRAEAAVGQLLEPLTTAWFDGVQATNLPNDEAARQAYYEGTFQQTALHVHTWGELDRTVYWQPGAYRIELGIATTRPNQTFRKTLRFDLTAQDVARLRNNRIPILRGVAGALLRLHFANRPYL